MVQLSPPKLLLTILLSGVVVITLFLQLQPVMADWDQFGEDVVGKNRGDNFGTSVIISADGSTIIARAPSYLRKPFGSLRISKINAAGSGFTKFGKSISGPEMYGPSFAISSDGTKFVVGVLDKGGFLGFGGACVYTINSSSTGYSRLGPDIVGDADERIGVTVEMSGDGATIVIRTSSGSIRVYKINSSGDEYVQFGSDIVAPVEYYPFADAVSISDDGTTFVVGASDFVVNGCNAGSAIVFKINSAGNDYVQFGSTLNGRHPETDDFGSSVSMSGDGTTIVVGAPGLGNRVSFFGSAYVFKINSSNDEYVQFGSEIVAEEVDDAFGSSVAISRNGRTLIVGAFRNNGVNGIGSGSARVFEINSSNDEYVQLGSDIDGEAKFDSSASSVDISGDGRTIVVGASQNDRDRGHYRVYKFIAPAPKVPIRTPIRTPIRAPIKNPVKAPTKAPVKAPRKAPTQG